MQLSSCFNLIPAIPAQKRGVTIFPRIIDPDQQKAKLLLLNENTDIYIWNADDRLGHLLAFVCFIVTISGQILQPGFEKCMTTKDSAAQE